MKYKKQKKKFKKRISVLEQKLEGNPLNAVANAELKMLQSILKNMKAKHETKDAAKTAQCICGFRKRTKCGYAYQTIQKPTR